METVFSTSESQHRDPAWIKQLVSGSILAIVLITGVLGKTKSAMRTSRIRASAMRLLRDSIVGEGKQHIKAMLGPPRALGNGKRAMWYYLLDNAEQIAMAIVFDDDHARDVEFFQSP